MRRGGAWRGVARRCRRHAGSTYLDNTLCDAPGPARAGVRGGIVVCRPTGWTGAAGRGLPARAGVHSSLEWSRGQGCWRRFQIAEEMGSQIDRRNPFRNFRRQYGAGESEKSTGVGLSVCPLPLRLSVCLFDTVPHRRLFSSFLACSLYHFRGEIFAPTICSILARRWRAAGQDREG